MSPSRPWSEIRAQAIRTPEDEAAVAEHRAELVQTHRTFTRLAELREGRGSQAAVGEQMGISQSGVAKLEAQEDLRLSTLARYAEGLGGRLELRVVFDDETVALDLAG